MTKSSRSRRARARAQRSIKKHTLSATENSTGLIRNTRTQSSGHVMSKTDKRYLLAFGVLSLAITLIYWWLGGRNLFVFPALMCISVGARKFWRGPIRRFADNA